MCAAEPAGGAKIRESRGTERTLHGLAFGARHLFMNSLEKIRDLWLRRADVCLDSTLGCALLAKMQLFNPTPLDFSELDYRFPILAQIADHLYDDLVNCGTTQLSAFEQ
jgi:hypothetical protein